jgi:retron-type reverse transcriptase
MPIRPTVKLDQSQLYKLRNRSKLAKILRISPAELERLSKAESLYSEFQIEKKCGNGFRTVENPSRPLKLTQARIARLLSRITPPDFLFCPVKRRCYVSNATAHLGNRVVHCLDIKKFFPSTPQRRVFWFFHKVMKCERDIAGTLASLACYQGHLPTGSPLSPIMAYFAYFDLWERISKFCKARGYKFTVYIDDITISGSKVPASDIWEVRKMISAVGLKYHKQKTFVDRPAEITGVMIWNGKAFPPNRQRKKHHDTRILLKSAQGDEQKKLKGRLAGLKGQLDQIQAKNLPVLRASASLTE